MSENDTQNRIPKKPKSRPFFLRFLPLLLVVLVILLSITSVYFYRKSISKNQNDSSQEEVISLVKKVGKLVFLPSDELPTVATVSDPAVLKDQAFFTEAKKGDKVLIFSNAKKAVLYDPIANKVITIAPLNISTKSNTDTTETTTETKKDEVTNN